MIFKLFNAFLLSLFFSLTLFANDLLLESIALGDFEKFKTNLNNSNKDYTNSKGEGIKDIISNKFIFEEESSISEQLILIDMISYYENFLLNPSTTETINTSALGTNSQNTNENSTLSFTSSIESEGEIVLIDIVERGSFFTVKLNSPSNILKSYELPELFDIFISDIDDFVLVNANIESSKVYNYSQEDIIDYLLSKSTKSQISSTSNTLIINNNDIETSLIYSSKSSSSILDNFYDSILNTVFGVNIDYVPNYEELDNNYFNSVDYANNTYEFNHKNLFFNTTLFNYGDYYEVVVDFSKLLSSMPELLDKISKSKEEYNLKIYDSFLTSDLKTISCKIDADDFMNLFTNDFELSYCKEIFSNKN